MLTNLRVNSLTIFVIVCCLIPLDLLAQKAVLKHSYTFDDGTAKDIIGDADGVIKGGDIENGKYVMTEEGQYIELPAKSIKINTYKYVSLEAYVTAGKVNGEYTVLSYFGNVTGPFGNNYIFQTLKNTGFARSAISCKNDSVPWASETSANCNPITDGQPHHIVTTFDNKELRFYVDGLLVNSQTNEDFPDNRLSNIGDQLAYLARSAYRTDPTWLGAIDAFNIYEGILDAKTIEKSARAYLPEEVLAARYKLIISTQLVESSKIDSIQMLISQSLDNEEKVRLLNEYARLNFYNQALIEGFNATIEARDLAKQLHFKGGEVMYNYTLASFEGGGDIFTYYIQKAKTLADSLGMDKLYKEPVFPENYPSRVDAEDIKRLLDAYEYFKGQGEKRIQAAILGPVSYGYYLANNWDELNKTFLKMVSLYKELGEEYPLIIYYGGLSYFIDFEKDEKQKEKVKNEIQAFIKELKSKKDIGPLNFQMANLYRDNGQFELALKLYLGTLNYFESIKDSNMMVNVYQEMSNLYGKLEMYPKQVEINDKLIDLLTKLKRYDDASYAKFDAVWPLHSVKQYDKARDYVNSLLKDTTNVNYLFGIARKNELEGLISMDSKNYQEAIPRFKEALTIYVPYNYYTGMQWVNRNLANCYYHLGEYKTALNYALKSMSYSEFVNSGDPYEKEINLTTSQIYEALGDLSLAFEYLKKYQQVIDKEKKSDANLGVFETLMSSFQEKSQEEINKLEQERVLKEQQNKTQRLWIFSITGALLSALLLAFILYRNNQNKQKANKLLQEQKAEIETQKKNVEETLTELKATQAQLVQSEKMASLGELTAGIAHEIQNPLNFVNNFSEVNSELLDDLKEAIATNDQAEIEAIFKDLKENESKVTSHGKRAESIVKGMLLHSRGSSGQKEPTDINAMADEYLRLAFHGFRAKDKSFNADFKLEADESLPKVNVVTQDIGRVLLNLINNAFYTVSEKSKLHASSYKPQVIVTTKSQGNKVEIRVQDNGSGISESVKEKIFQPFFTTKPTGQGTGLGLSMSYDIVKAHGGELDFNSDPATGTTFILTFKLT